MRRNMKATCGNCPYWDSVGYCRLYPNCDSKHSLSWCGQHPDFFLPEPVINKKLHLDPSLARQLDKAQEGRKK